MEIRTYIVRPVLSALMALTIGACAYRPGDEGNPILRSFSWFSYLNADDIRTSCRSGEKDRYRIIYNGVWQEHIRTYDITIKAGKANLVTQVRGAPDFSREIPLGDLFSPWRGQMLHSRINAHDMVGLKGALRESRFYTPVPQNMRVKSWGFFWVAAACEGGRFTFNAWDYPSRRFAGVTLARFLNSIDMTGIPFAKPRPTEKPDGDENEDVDRYELVVRGDGFADNLKLF